MADMARPHVLTPAGGAIESSEQGRSQAEAARPAARERQGKALVVAGWITAVIGIVLYCAASFAGETDADLAAILFHGAVPAARAALVVIGCGTLLWVVGTVVHANAALDGAEVEPSGREGDAGRPASRRDG